MIKPSKHAIKRIKERCGISKKSAGRLCALVDERGVDMRSTKGNLKKWLDRRYSGGTIKVYGDKAFIISEDSVLITVLQIPAAIMKNKSRMLVPSAI